MTSKVLIITYYWPPSGGAGVQRWLKFAKYLPEAGWDPIILTVDPDYAAYPVTDNSLEEEIPPSLRVYKTKATNYFSVYKNDKSRIPVAGFANSVDNTFKGKIMRFIRGNFFIPDPRKGWNEFAFRKANELIKSEGIKYIITTSPPHSTQLVGLKIKQKHPSIIWTADLRDPWTDIYYYNLFYPTIISKAIDSNLEKKVIRAADRIITVGSSLKDSFVQKVPSAEAKFRIIPNGYDEDDFREMSSSIPQIFTISYTGTLSDSYPLTGFLKALDLFRAKGNKFLLRFVGTVTSGQHDLIISAAGHENVDFVSYTNHKSAIKYMALSSLLLLIIPEHKSSKSIITGKVFEYIAAGKPILCLGPDDGDAARVIESVSGGKTFGYSDISSILKYIEDVSTGRVNGSNNDRLIYSRKELTRKIFAE